MSLALSLAVDPAAAQTDAELLPDVTGQDDGSLETTAPLAPRPVPEAIKEAEKEAERATEQATNGASPATVAPTSQGERTASPAPEAAAADPSETPKLPAELAAELETLITTLEDESARTKLISQLRLLLETQAEPAPADEEAPRTQSFGGQIAGAILSRAILISDRSAQALTYLRQLPNVGQWFQRQVSDPRRRDGWIEIIWQLATIFAAGLVADLVFRFGLNRLRLRLAPREGDYPLERALILFGRGLVKLVPIAAFTVGAYFAMIALDPDVTVQWVTVGLLWAALAARTIAVTSRVIFRPDIPELRILRMDDQSCRDAHSRVIWLSGLTIYGYAGIEVLRYLGVPTALEALLKLGLGLAVAILSIRLVLLTGRRLTEWMRGGKSAEVPAQAQEPEFQPVGRLGRLRQMFADFWQVAVVAYILVVYVIWAFDVQDGFAYLIWGTSGTLLVVAGAVIIHALARRVAEFSIKFNDTWRARYPTFEKRLDFYIRMAHRAAVLLVDIAAVFLILEVWGVDSLSWLATPLGREVLSDAVSIAIVIIIAVVIWEILGFLIEGHLNRRGADGRPLMASTRVRTLLPVIRNAILIALSILVALTALSEFGVNIGPLLAGVGVLGIAVGFGAQELVKDVINGMFILFDNSVSVGDVVDIGGHAGVVEAMNIRTIRLRDLSGTVHVVPLSQVSSIINMTRDFSYALIDVGVAYREDVDEVIEVLRDLARDMRDDPDWRYKILEDLEVLGLDQLADSAVVIRVRSKTVAGEQWGVRREFNRRMKKRFDELGIEIPFPHQTLYFGEDKEGRAPVAKVSMESPSAAERIARDAELGPAALRRRHAQKTENPRVVGEAEVADVADGD